MAAPAASATRAGRLHAATAITITAFVLFILFRSGTAQGYATLLPAYFASLGYTAAAADMHGGGKVLADEEIPAALDAFREDPAKLRRRARAGLR